MPFKKNLTALFLKEAATGTHVGSPASPGPQTAEGKSLQWLKQKHSLTEHHSSAVSNTELYLLALLIFALLSASRDICQESLYFIGAFFQRGICLGFLWRFLFLS